MGYSVIGYSVMSYEIIPAILPKTFREIEEKLMLVRGLVDTVQIDFCEGGFFMHQPLPFPSEFDFEAHLMVSDPRSLMDDIVRAGFSRVLVQVEELPAEAFAELIHEWRGSVAIAPSLEIKTPLSAIDSFAHELKSVQLMGIAHIGKQGEPFDERVVARVGEAHARFPHFAIAVDGGVSLQSAPALLAAGASRLVVGSVIFGADNPRAAIAQLKSLV